MNGNPTAAIAERVVGVTVGLCYVCQEAGGGVRAVEDAAVGAVSYVLG
jgi:hypothetical protein